MTAKELRAIREGLGMTQQQLAERIGVAEHTVWRWENEYARISPPVANLVRTFVTREPVSA